MADWATAKGTTKQLDKETEEFYGQMIDSEVKAEDVGELTFHGLMQDKLKLIFAIGAGLPYSIFDLISELIPLSEQEWADVLDLSIRSLQRYKRDDHLFKRIHSEKIFEIAEVAAKGRDVFGSNDRFRTWLETPNYALGRLKPLELLSDSYGKELVIAELHRIEHGVLS